MPLYMGDKPCVIYKGDAKPVNLYQGDRKLAGWRWDEQTDTDMPFDRTYNDRVDVAALGRSKQAVSVQGKNLFDINRVALGPETTRQNGIITIQPTTAYQTSSLSVVVQPSTQYTVWADMAGGVNSPHIAISEYDEATLITGNKRVLNLGGSPHTFVTSPGVNRLVFDLRNRKAVPTTFSAVHFQIGTPFTGYEPFVPNSPSPAYPSPIISSAGIIRSEDRHGNGVQYDTGILRGIPDGSGGWIARDELTVELVGGEWHLMMEQRAGMRQIPTTTRWNDWNVTERRVLDPAPNRLSGLDALGFCTHAKVSNRSFGALKSDTLGCYHSNASSYWSPNWELMGLTGDESRSDADITLQAWLAANEVWYSYTPYRPIITHPIDELRGIPATYNPDGSVATWAARDREYIARVDNEWHRMREEQVGRRVFDGNTVVTLFLPPAQADGYTLSRIACSCPGIKLSPTATSEIFIMSDHFKAVSSLQTAARVNGKMYARANGRPEVVFDTPFSTQAEFLAWLAANPVTVDYVLATPIITDLGPIDLPSYYPYTRVLVEGEYAPDVTVRCRVVDG